MTFNHKVIILFLIPLFALFVPVSGETENPPEQILADLTFHPIPEKKDLFVSIDPSGNKWIKGKIPDTFLNQAVIFQIPSIEITNYSLYIYQNNQIVSIEENINGKGKPIRGRYALYYFNTDRPVYYLNIGTQSFNKLQVHIDRPDAFMQSEANSMAWEYLYYGLLIMSLIFSFLLFFIFKNVRFILYFFLQLSLLFTFFYEDGIFYYLLGGTTINPNISFFNSAITSMLAGIFSYYFLDLKYRAPRFKKTTTIIATAMFSVIVIYILTNIAFFHVLTSLSFFLIPVLCFYHAIKWFKKDIYARSLILTFGIVVLAGALYTLGKFVASPLLSNFNFNIFRLTNILVISSITFIILFKVRNTQRGAQEDKKILEKKLAELEGINKGKLLLQKESSPRKSKFVKDTKAHILSKLEKRHRLTKRETEVLACIFDRRTNHEIANILAISMSTTKYHVSNVYFKLGVTNRQEAHKMLDGYK